MQNKYLIRWSTFTVFGFFFLLSHNSYGQILITEVRSAELPATLLPSSRSKIVMEYDGQLGSGTNADVLGSHMVSGHYRISSDTNSTISINIASNEDVPNIELKTFKIRYQGVTYKSFPATGLPSPGAGEDVYIGFTAIIRSGANEGESFPTFVFDVIEEN